MSKVDRIAVVAAGGFATRMGSNIPKSLLEVRGCSYLSILLDEIGKVYFDHVLIYNDRIDCMPLVKRESLGCSNLEVIYYPKVVSTYELAKHASSLHRNADIMFFYGHSPRPVNYIVNLLASSNDGCIAYSYEKSTKVNLVESSDKRFIEPPMLIDARALEHKQVSCWASLFDYIGAACTLIHTDEPSEFNTCVEELVYSKYVEDWYF